MGPPSRDVDHLGVVHFPTLPDERIGSFRRAHDPTAVLIRPHVTLVFPLPSEVGRDALRDHVRRVVSATPAFDIRLRGLERSWDHWLFLLVDDGSDRLVELHDALYGWVLEPYLRADLPYVPHLGLGLFAHERADLLDPRPRTLDTERFERALSEAEAMDLDVVTRLGSVHIVGLDSGLTHMTVIDEILLAVE